MTGLECVPGCSSTISSNERVDKCTTMFWQNVRFTSGGFRSNQLTCHMDDIAGRDRRFRLDGAAVDAVIIFGHVVDAQREVALNGEPRRGRTPQRLVRKQLAVLAPREIVQYGCDDRMQFFLNFNNKT